MDRWIPERLHELPGRMLGFADAGRIEGSIDRMEMDSAFLLRPLLRSSFFFFFVF
jgi:hypothetical protein